MTDVWTVKRVLDWAASDFKNKGIEPARLEAEVLLSHVLGCTRLALYTEFDRPLDEGELSPFREVVQRRRKGEPAAYITGKREFWSLEFAVTSGVLVPRPETETLVERALELLGEEGEILDLCTGTGCVAIAMAKERSRITVDAVDLSPEACDVARANVGNHGLVDRVKVTEGDLFEPLDPASRYLAIVSNPPYVIDAEIENLSTEVRSEPRMALAGGSDGLDVVKRILAKAPEYLEAGGRLLLEIDPSQAGLVASAYGPELFGSAGEIIKDLSGRERVVVFTAS